MSSIPKSWSTTAAALLAFSLCAGPPVFAWGSNGHIDINQVAAERIPADMPPFLRTKSAVAKIAYLGPEPDRWRNGPPSALNYSQAPDHFIDLERIEGVGPLPGDRYLFFKMMYAKSAATPAADHPNDFLPDRVGLQPYITIEIYQRIVQAFRDYRQLIAHKQKTDVVEGNIIFYMGWLGHYVADGSQPLHTTVNYDGWIEANPQGYPTAHGIHSYFENDFVNRVATAKTFGPLVHGPRTLHAPFDDYQKYLWETHSHVPDTYQFAKDKAFDGMGTAASVKFLNERLAAGAQQLIDLWYTAWLESGVPFPPAKNAGQ